ncbi:MAG: 50S ribosomal protein L25 [Acidimicrobiales bacterium]|nr:50S ribosomal protein L25 [Acidimicrobiales bacterium]RZV42989.1 MAG: 50S ribosomal protein L25 [Acidimicrobiales bacterium]
MSELLLTATTGREAGTRSSRRLRAEGLVPAVVYGLGSDPLAVSVEWPELRRVLTTDAGVNALIRLDIDGDKQLSIVKDIQRHPVRRDVIHVDFIRIDANATITVDVPLTLIGEALEVTQESGMVDQNLFSLPVNSRPDDIPTEITLDISALTVGESLHVSDLQLPEGVTTDVDPEEAVASGVVTRSTLEAMRADEEAEAAELLEGEEGAEGEGAEGDAEGGDDGDGGGDDS